jgi:hypothetical protein
MGTLMGNRDKCLDLLGLGAAAAAGFVLGRFLRPAVTAEPADQSLLSEPAKVTPQRLVPAGHKPSYHGLRGGTGATADYEPDEEPDDVPELSEAAAMAIIVGLVLAVIAALCFAGSLTVRMYHIDKGRRTAVVNTFAWNELPRQSVRGGELRMEGWHTGPIAFGSNVSFYDDVMKPICRSWNRNNVSVGEQFDFIKNVGVPSNVPLQEWRRSDLPDVVVYTTMDGWDRAVLMTVPVHIWGHRDGTAVVAVSRLGTYDAHYLRGLALRLMAPQIMTTDELSLTNLLQFVPPNIWVVANS